MDSQAWRNTRVYLNAHVQRSMGELVDGWVAHVERIVAELGADGGDRTVWGVCDYVAALHLRDAVERGLQALGRAPLAVVSEVAAIDRLFIDNTEEDRNALLASYMVVERTSSNGWWWRRVPSTGPIAFDLAGEGHGA